MSQLLIPQVRALATLVAVAACPAAMLAASNSVTITDTSGAIQTNRPFSISRVFAQGEISAFAQPRINGTPVPVWQCDRKTSWSDGSLSHAIISFQATVPANASITVDFVTNANACSSGNQSACNAAALTSSQMLAFNSNNWDAAIQTSLTTGGTAGSPAGTAHARKMITDGNFRYWLQGPVVTEVIAEDRSSSLAYDMGLDSNKSIHPYFVLTFYPGWNGVKEQFIAENVWRQKLQDQVYNLTLLSGATLGTTQYSKSSYTHTWQARWRKVFWDGSSPGAVNIDFNLPYMASSKALPNYDTTKVPSSTAISNEIASFNSTDQGDLSGHAQVLQYMPQVGGREDIGLIPGWYALYLYNFGAGLNAAMLGNGAVSAYVPMHVRESSASLFYDQAASVNAFGHTISLNALPNVSWDNPGGSGSPAITGIATTTNAGWAPDVAHFPNLQYVPYLVTGDYYWLEELQFWAAYCLMNGNPTGLSYGRHGAWGFLNVGDVQVRGQAWALRTIAEASFMSPDGTPEKLYFKQMIDNNTAVHEGVLNLTTGSFYDPSSSSMWYWGRNTAGLGLPQTLHIDWQPGGTDSSGSQQSVPPTCQTFAQYEDHFHDIAWNHAVEVGFSEVAPVAAEAMRAAIHQLVGPDYNPYVASESYWSPLTTNGSMACTGTDPYLSTWSAVLNAFYPLDNGATEISNSTTAFKTDTDTVGGYGFITNAALSFATNDTDGTLTGLSAWNWIHTNLPNQNLLNDNPTWAFLPRNVTSTAVSPCDLNADGVVNALDVSIAVNQALGVQACTLTGEPCDIVSVQRVIESSMGQACLITT